MDRQHRFCRVLSLALLAAGCLAAPLQSATVRFRPAVYDMAESARLLRVTLVIEAPECPAGAFQVLEPTLLLIPVESGTATLGEDFQTREDVVPLGASSHSVDHWVRGLLVDDQLPEGTETFHLRMEVRPGAQIRCTANDQLFDLVAEGEATVAIVDDDSMPTLRVEAGAPVDEGDPGTAPHQVLFHVRLNRPSPSPGPIPSTITVRYVTEPGTAQAGVDYQTVQGLLTFAPSESDKRVAVSIRGDLQQEGTETFSLHLFEPQGAEVAAASAVGTIRDDDSTGLQIEEVEGNPRTGSPGGELPLEVRITKSGKPVAGVVVSWDVEPEEKARLAALTSTTDGAGKAQNRVTLTPLAEGEVRVTARVSDASASPGSQILLVLSASPVDERCRNPEKLPPEVRKLCAAQQRPDLRELDPDEAAVQGTVALAGVRLQHRLITDRVGGVRGGSEGTGSGPVSAFAVTGTASGSGPTSDREAGFDYRLRCFAAGADKELPGSVLLGGAAAYTDGEVDHLGSDGSLATRSLSLSAYAAYQAGLDAFHLEGIVTWGRQHTTEERVVALSDRDRRVARSTPEGTLLALSLGGGSGVDLGPMRLEGYGYAHWAEVATAPYGEHGAGDFDLALARDRQRSLVAEAGCEVLYRQAFANWGFAVYLDSSAVRELADDSRRIRFRFVHSPDPRYSSSVTTEPPDRDYFNFEAGLTVKLPGPWAAFLSIQKEVQRDDLESRSALLGVQFQF